MYVPPVIRNAESMVLHTGAPAYVTQDNNLNRDMFAILLRDTFLSFIACWQSQEKYGQSGGAKDSSTKEIIPKTVQQFRWHLEGKCALLKGYRGRSTSFSLNSNAGQSRATNRSNPASPIDGPANTRYTFEDAHVSNHSMKGKTQTRPRGDSDLGKPLQLRPVTNAFAAFTSVPVSPITTSRTSLSNTSSVTSEIINGILIPLPFLLAAIAFPIHGPSTSGVAISGTASHPYDTTTLEGERKEETHPKGTFYEIFTQTCTLTAAALLLVGILAQIQTSNQSLDRRKKKEGSSSVAKSLMQLGTIRAIVARIMSLALPYYASIQLGGLRTVLNLVLVILSGLTSVIQSNQVSKGHGGIFGAMRSRKFTCAAVLLFACSDLFGMTSSAGVRSLTLGYIALVLSALVFPVSLPISNERPNVLARTISNPRGFSITTPPPTPRLNSSGTTATGSSIFASRAEANITLAGPFLRDVVVQRVLSGFCSVYALFLLRLYGLEMSPYVYWTFGALGWFATLLDDTERFGSKVAQHKEHDHKPTHSSLFTTFLLKFCSPGSVMDTILRERDSRRIAYFGCLNLAFMVVQVFYGFATGSLGLLTDSIHMLFDCLGLAVGLAAAVMTRLDFWSTLSGLWHSDTPTTATITITAILMTTAILIRITRRTRILTITFTKSIPTITTLTNITSTTTLTSITSTTTLTCIMSMTTLTNIMITTINMNIMITTINMNIMITTINMNIMITTINMKIMIMTINTNIHTSIAMAMIIHHENENMTGIFLHIMADALGSVAVIISTILAKRDGWSGWDPVASCIIAIMIFISAIPLVKTSGMKLLLALPTEVEWASRDALQGISELRGVLGYSGVRLWLQDKVAEVQAHGHDHGHDHGHSHSHGEEQGQKVLGVMHVIAMHGADLEDVRERVVMYLLGRDSGRER
ncbi:hypothetical protein BLS_003484 [Venturia inaequalis]|uniref:Zinc transporter n=1 Tax=Venturia inaequalis TaxID=5025 RepID=A0A8H3YTX8_VENIN|nr:hypothetical protein BLS_003484 [Venturia inaequalis]